MPYTASFYLYLFVAGVVVVVLANLLSPLGLLVNLVFAVAAAYLAIVIGRRVLGRSGKAGRAKNTFPQVVPRVVTLFTPVSTSVHSAAVTN
jgi:membrane protein implicated in regulation of membrane protease activity